MIIDKKKQSLFISRLVLYWLAILLVALILVQAGLDYSFTTIAFTLLIALTLLLLIKELLAGLIHSIPYLFKDLDLTYITRLKNNQGFKDFSQEDQQLFLQTMKTYYYHTLSTTLPLGGIGLICTVIGLIIDLLIIQFLGLSLIIMAIIYTLPFKWSDKKMINIISFEKQKIADYDMKYKILITDEIRKQMNE